ncbi:hypothetical protein MMC07_008254 [Pseudocyphellaria aurata]|nr:hypothetical protein [Pseudocyphellaria aurata]
MHYSLAVLAVAAIVTANPVALPQAVTEKLFPTGTAPPACKPTLKGSFGIAASALEPTAAAVKRAESSTLECEPLTLAHVSQIIDGQCQKAITPVTFLSVNQTGKCQWAQATSSSDGTLLHPVINIAQPTSTTKPVEAPPTVTPVPVVTPTPAATSSTPSLPPPASTPSSPSLPPPPPPPPSPSTSASSSSSPPPPPPPPPPSSTASSISAPAPPPAPVSTSSAVAPPADETEYRHPIVYCEQPGSLAITLEDGVLKDQSGRTGYIAANYQLQFDGPPQAGAIITAGFSVCNNGSLALGGSAVFYQCLSGTFYNLYDRSWAAQCSPIIINTLMLKHCAA